MNRHCEPSGGTDDPSADTHASRGKSLLTHSTHRGSLSSLSSLSSSSSILSMRIISDRIRVDRLALFLPSSSCPSVSRRRYRRSFFAFSFFWSRGFCSPRFFSHARFSNKQKHEQGPGFGDGALARGTKGYVMPVKPRGTDRVDTRGRPTIQSRSGWTICAIGLKTDRRFPRFAVRLGDNIFRMEFMAEISV